MASEVGPNQNKRQLTHEQPIFVETTIIINKLLSVYTETCAASVFAINPHPDRDACNLLSMMM